MIGEITHLQQHLNEQGRLFLREPIAALPAKEIKGFRYRIGGFSEPLASEFRAAAQDG